MSQNNDQLFEALNQNSETLIEKIRKSIPTIQDDSASEAFSSLFSKTNWVWFSSNNIPFAAVYLLVDRFVYGLAGITLDGKFIATSSPLQILRSRHSINSKELDASYEIILTALVYENGAVILIDNGFLNEQTLLLLLDEQTCKENGINYEKVDFSTSESVQNDQSS